MKLMCVSHINNFELQHFRFIDRIIVTEQFLNSTSALYGHSALVNMTVSDGVSPSPEGDRSRLGPLYMRHLVGK